MPKKFLIPVALILVLQGAALHLLAIPEKNLPPLGLQDLPFRIGQFQAGGEESMEADVTAYLRPDEYVLRDYVDPRTGTGINLFVAYFKSLQNSYGPHSPRVCLPGNGWLVRSSSIKPIPVAGHENGIPVNEYVMEKSGARMLVLYWYQNDRNVWAEEFQAKLTMLPDLIRYRRSDVSLVRLITAMQGETGEAELARAVTFAKTLFPPLEQRFENTK